MYPLKVVLVQVGRRPVPHCGARLAEQAACIEAEFATGERFLEGWQGSHEDRRLVAIERHSPNDASQLVRR